VHGQYTGPEVEGVYVLPVVDSLVGLLRVVGDTLTEVNGELTDVSETGLVSNFVESGESDNLGGGVLHEVDSLDGVSGGLSAGLYQAGVKSLQGGLLDSLISDNGGTTDNQERGDTSGLIGGVGSPDLDNGLEEGLKELAKVQEVGDELEDGVEEELLGGGVGEEREKVHQGLRVRFEEGSEGAVFLAVGGDANLARGGLLDGEMVLEDLGDVLEGDDEELVVDWSKVSHWKFLNAEVK
jgi:hypothetical protein